VKSQFTLLFSYNLIELLFFFIYNFFTFIVTGKNKVAAKKPAAAPTNVERELTEEEVDETVMELLSPEILSGLGDGNWKTRLSAAEQFLQVTLFILFYYAT
jgi:hypothetical protein